MDQENVGKFIKKIRVDNGLTQNEFAKKFGVTYQAVSKWENGKNIPDIYILKEISKEFNISLDEIIVGRKKKKLNIINFIVVIGLILIFLLLLCIFVCNHKSSKNNFEFKTITTSCREFNITGSAAYNKDKTSIYISNINYCGGEDNTVYKKISCTLYEKYKDTNKKISSCNSVGKNKTLDEFLKNVKINVNDYSSNCKNSSSLYLEINAFLDGDKMISYRVPIKFSDNCN